MIITVTKQAFMWKSPDGKKHVASELCGPTKCKKEYLRVIREGEEIDTAEINTSPYLCSAESFVGLFKITKNQHRATLTPDLFDEGDELHISGIPVTLTELGYWRELTI